MPVESLGTYAREQGLTSSVVHARLKAGWTTEEALTIPKGTRRARAHRR